MDAFCIHGKLRTRCRICNPMIDTTTSPKIFIKDRNLAFKCNWLDTDYDGACGKAGRRWNIHIKRFPWCTQPENPCYQYEIGLRKDIPQFPCYETEIFAKSEYGAGVNHRVGPRKGTGRKIRYVVPGKLALFTTVDPGKSGESRYIFGFFVIKDDYIESDGATKIVGYPEYTLKIPRDSRLRFWDFHRNSDGSTFWGSGLVRYINDEAVVNYLKRQAEVLVDNGHTNEAKLVRRVMRKFYE
jgi:hypothetical protein